jgi:hypothetical protein
MYGRAPIHSRALPATVARSNPAAGESLVMIPLKLKAVYGDAGGTCPGGTKNPLLAQPTFLALTFSQPGGSLLGGSLPLSRLASAAAPVTSTATATATATKRLEKRIPNPPSGGYEMAFTIWSPKRYFGFCAPSNCGDQPIEYKTLYWRKLDH